MKAPYLITLSLILVQLFAYAQCDTNLLERVDVRAQDTDGNIGWELAKHNVYFNPDCSSRDRVLLYLVGSYDSPNNTTYFPKLAANNGFHVIVLKYDNSVAAKTACAGSSDPDCYLDFRKEIIEGVDYSIEVTVDLTNSILNRTEKLLEYLNVNQASQNWGQFLNNGNIEWSKFLVAGHSQGGGHAALLGKEYLLERVLMFSAPNDYSNHFSGPASWVSGAGLTSDSLFYSFLNLNDDVVDFSEQHEIAEDLNLNIYGDTVFVKTASSPYGFSRQLYTDDLLSGTSAGHNATVRDSDTPMLIDEPLFTNVWKYMLGIEDVSASRDENLTLGFIIYPNPGNDVVRLESDFEIQDYSIYDMIGNLVRSKTINSSIVLIDAEELKTGMYIIQVCDRHGVKAIKTWVKI